MRGSIVSRQGKAMCYTASVLQINNTNRWKLFCVFVPYKILQAYWKCKFHLHHERPITIIHPTSRMMGPSEAAAQLRRFADEIEQASNGADDLIYISILAQVKLFASQNKPHPLRLVDELYCDQIRLALLRIAIDTGLFQAIAKGSEDGLGVLALAKAVNVDPALLHRILRVFVATGDVVRTADGGYKNSGYTDALANTWLASAAQIELNVLGKVFRQAPDLIKQSGYREPTNAKQTGCHSVLGGKSYFEYLDANPDLLSYWNISMANFGVIENMLNQKWYDLWPVQKRLLDGYERSSGPLLVDVGGGNEKRAKAFLDSLPEPYPLVVQDLPEAIEEAQKSRESLPRTLN